ncbi:MAG: hypothetical protein GXP13_07440 [Gammaproteobacteria bacterium]|nr:hypothetical protein [Gammaproteobacteria bacterium]
MNKNNPLTFRDRAILFKQLSVLQKLGLDYEQIMSKISEGQSTELSRLTRQCANNIKHGKPLDIAAQSAGLFSATESAIIKTALHTGTTDKIFAAIAIKHEKNDNRLRKIKSRLFLPAGILILAGFISPLPSLASGELSATRYVFQGTLFAFLIIITLKKLLQLPTKLSHASASNNALTKLDSLILKTPIIGKWYIKRESSKWLDLAGTCLEAGLPMHDIIPLINKSMISQTIRQSFETSQQLLLNGSTVYDALKNNPTLSYEARQLILTGETSGRLGEMLKHSASQENERLQLLEDQIADWVPRIIYFMVLAALASNILGSSITPTTY